MPAQIECEQCVDLHTAAQSERDPDISRSEPRLPLSEVAAVCRLVYSGRIQIHQELIYMGPINYSRLPRWPAK